MTSRQTHRNWCFTWFQCFEKVQKTCYDELGNKYEEGCLVSEELKQRCLGDNPAYKYITFGEENTLCGRRHLQGYVEFDNPIRLPGVIKALVGNLTVTPPHVEKALSKREHNKAYCAKGEQPHEEWETLGVNGPNYGKNAIVFEYGKPARNGQGRRTDWHNLLDFVKENPDFKKIMEEFPEMAIRYPNGIQKMIDIYSNEVDAARLADEFKDMKLFMWEQGLLNELETTPHSRKIIWYVDHKGGCGKSTFAKYLMSKGDCAYFNNSKTADIAYAWKGERTVIFDFSRQLEEHVNYGVIESIKNGLIFSAKYNSNTKCKATPHIVVFSNFDPNKATMSADRWDIRVMDINRDCLLVNDVPDIETHFDTEKVINNIEIPVDNIADEDVLTLTGIDKDNLITPLLNKVCSDAVELAGVDKSDDIDEILSDIVEEVILRIDEVHPDITYDELKKLVMRLMVIGQDFIMCEDDRPTDE